MEKVQTNLIMKRNISSYLTELNLERFKIAKQDFIIIIMQCKLLKNLNLVNIEIDEFQSKKEEDYALNEKFIQSLKIVSANNLLMEFYMKLQFEEILLDLKCGSEMIPVAYFLYQQENMGWSLALKLYLNFDKEILFCLLRLVMENFNVKIEHLGNQCPSM